MNLNLNYNSIDYSLKWEDFGGPGYDITLLSTQFIWIGFRKPINSIYIELKNSIVSTCKLKIECAKASGFVDADDIQDSTYGLGNSGKICWNNDNKDIVQTTQFGKKLFWYKLSVDVDCALRTIIGINTIFSYDSDLDEEYPNISKFLPEDDNGNRAQSFIKFHMSARKEIVQFLRKKYFENKLLDQFDLLNIDEVRQASKYLTLSKIFFWLADTVDDKWRIKSREFYKIFTDFVDAVTLTVDVNDDGIEDPAESNAIQSIQVSRE